jgi:hypothetical protein
MLYNDKLAINFFLIKKMQTSILGELHVKSFFKSTSLNSITKVLKVISKLLYTLLLILKRILLKYKMYNHFFFNFKPYCIKQPKISINNTSHCILCKPTVRHIYSYTQVSKNKAILNHYKKI